MEKGVRDNLLTENGARFTSRKTGLPQPDPARGCMNLALCCSTFVAALLLTTVGCGKGLPLLMEEHMWEKGSGSFKYSQVTTGELAGKRRPIAQGAGGETMKKLSRAILERDAKRDMAGKGVRF